VLGNEAAWEKSMSFLIVLGALIFLMFVAYRGYSVIMFAPVAALLAVLLTDPTQVLPMFTGVFMEKMVGFVKLYFPVFMLGAIFGKVIELSGFSKAIVSSVINFVGQKRAMLSIVLVCAILTYGGVSLFVVVFAVYPFAAEMFKQGGIPKRLIPGTIALGAFTFTMDSLPGTPQIQNIIPTTFFKTTTYAAPWLGIIGSLFILAVGLTYLDWRRRQAAAKGEGYGTILVNEPEAFEEEKLANPWIALLPLIVVGVLNKIFTMAIPQVYGSSYVLSLGGHPLTIQIGGVAAIWAVEGALLVGILTVLAFAFKPVMAKFADGTKAAVAGALLASMNTASEYGFGGVIASLPGFVVVADALKAIPNPLVNEAITVTTLAGITGSASGGMSIALAAMSDTFIQAANAAHIPLEVFHRVASMASGCMDTLPHNGAVITLLAVTGLTHKTSYGDIFAVTCIKTAAVFVVITFYYLTGIY
jgi:H+/gluconate symporter-like permease